MSETLQIPKICIPWSQISDCFQVLWVKTREKTIADLSRSNSFIFSLYARVNFTRVEKEQLIYPLSALVSCVSLENLLHGKQTPICRLLTLAELSVFLSASLLSPSGTGFWPLLLLGLKSKLFSWSLEWTKTCEVLKGPVMLYVIHFCHKIFYCTEIVSIQ